MPVTLIFDTWDYSFAPLFYAIYEWTKDNFPNSKDAYICHADTKHEVKQLYGMDAIPLNHYSKTNFILEITFNTDEAYNLFRLMFTGYKRYLRPTLEDVMRIFEE